jgi:hypothetical protein
MAVLFPALRKWKKQINETFKSKAHAARQELFEGTPETLQKQAAKRRTEGGLAVRWLVYPACEHQFVLPNTIERVDAGKFGPWKVVRRQPYYVYRLPRTLYHGKSGATVDSQQRVFKDLLDWGAQGSPKLLSMEKKVACFSNGNSAVLSSSKNYYHWLIKMLPRLHLLERIGMPPSAFDALLINWPNSVQKDAYHHSDLASHALQVVSSRDFWFCRNLFVSTVPHDAPPWALEYLRKLFAPLIASGTGGSKTIYLARGKTQWRRVRNEQEVSEWLQDRGIETVDFGKYSFEDQVRAIASADIIIAPHGAALANIVFASSGTRVLEIFGSAENQKCYWMVAEHRQLIYHYFMAELIDSSQDPNRCDLLIPLEKLERALDCLIQDRR